MCVLKGCTIKFNLLRIGLSGTQQKHNQCNSSVPEASTTLLYARDVFVCFVDERLRLYRKGTITFV